MVQPPTPEEPRDKNGVLQVREIIKKKSIQKIDIQALQVETTFENVETNQSPIKFCPSTSNLIHPGEEGLKHYPLDLEKLNTNNNQMFFSGQVREISFRVMSSNSNEIIN